MRLDRWAGAGAGGGGLPCHTRSCWNKGASKSVNQQGVLPPIAGHGTGGGKHR